MANLISRIAEGLAARAKGPTTPPPAPLGPDATPAERLAHSIAQARHATAAREAEQLRVAGEYQKPIGYADLEPGSNPLTNLAQGLAARGVRLERVTAESLKPVEPVVIPPPPIEDRPVISEATWEANRRAGLGPQ
jgi:hypothetical protein